MKSRNLYKKAMYHNDWDRNIKNRVVNNLIAGLIIVAIVLILSWLGIIS